MIENLTEKWSRITRNAQKRFRWLGLGLTIAAFVYLIALLILSDFNLREIPWEVYWEVSILALGLYLLSLIIQFVIWARMLSFHHKIGWLDMVIYSRVLVMRRLPGGIWHWVGRAAMYTGATEIPGKTIMLANFLEWAMLILIAVGITCFGIDPIPPILRWLLLILCLGLSAGLAYKWQPGQRRIVAKSSEAIVWAALYCLSWIFGGLIVYSLTQAAGGEALTWLRATWVWAVTGGSSFLLVFIPAGLGIREITLNWLLSPYLAPTDAILIAVLIRIIFTLADILWGSLGWGISQFFLNKKAGELPIR
jgi:hypothetical protein